MHAYNNNRLQNSTSNLRQKINNITKYSFNQNNLTFLSFIHLFNITLFHQLNVTCHLT